LKHIETNGDLGYPYLGTHPFGVGDGTLVEILVDILEVLRNPMWGARVGL